MCIGDIMFFICHVISQDHVTRESCDYGNDRLTVSHHSAWFGGHRHCGSGDMMFLVCHVILQDHEIKQYKIVKGDCLHADAVNKNTALVQKIYYLLSLLLALSLKSIL